ncbi:MAG: LemA family protein [Betaproteobacteria bacterium]|jgi:LemA protein|nr:MAG: LemA family protein [Betaproteobacteria bacterium SG8_41]UCF74869.1 MAG: LemA family protein [Betaproteobacteria bacterium]
MGIGTAIVLGTLLVIVVYATMLYNNLVQLKHNVAKAWANIDVLLKQRHDELPKLVETCKQYMKFEQETLQKVMEARSKVFAARETQNIPELGQAEGALRATLGHLFALAEAYPDLKTNQSFQQLQARISSLENAIADRREFYNESVNVNNVRVEQFPDTIIAGMFNFKQAQLLEFGEAEKADVNMKQLFSV